MKETSPVIAGAILNLSEKVAFSNLHYKEEASSCKEKEGRTDGSDSDRFLTKLTMLTIKGSQC